MQMHVCRKLALHFRVIGITQELREPVDLARRKRFATHGISTDWSVEQEE